MQKRRAAWDQADLGTLEINDLPARPLAWLSLLGPVVYAARPSADVIKIGWTTDLAHRLSYLGGLSALLAWTPGDREDEREIHADLAGHALRGREWYPSDDLEVLRVVNRMRERLGLPECEVSS